MAHLNTLSMSVCMFLDNSLSLWATPLAQAIKSFYFLINTIIHKSIFYVQLLISLVSSHVIKPFRVIQDPSAVCLGPASPCRSLLHHNDQLAVRYSLLICADRSCHMPMQHIYSSHIDYVRLFISCSILPFLSCKIHKNTSHVMCQKMTASSLVVQEKHWYGNCALNRGRVKVTWCGACNLLLFFYVSIYLKVHYVGFFFWGGGSVSRNGI